MSKNGGNMAVKRIYEGKSAEITEKKSRFIAHIFDIENEEQANDYINKVKKQYWDARHNCYAYVCGESNEVMRFSDDGEPSGTAGKPILEVIAGAGVKNCLAVVTRYFGGTLLGTGGLIRAYQSATKAGLEESVIVDVMTGKKRSLVTDYNNVGKLQYMCAASNVSIINTEYSENVQMELIIEESGYNAFVKQLTEGFAGSIELVGEQNVQYAVIDGRVEEL